MTRAVIKVYLVLAVIGGAAVLASFLGISLCVFYNVLGIPCPACGMSRAFIALPDVRRAFAYHPLFFTVPFVPLLAAAKTPWQNRISVLLIILFLAVWIGRNLTLWPDILSSLI